MLNENVRYERNIADYAVDLVVALGSRTVFSLTGGMAMHLNRAVASHSGLKAVYCQHEQACVAAAEGYAKAADFREAGFAVVTAGPGVSNSLTSLISANGDSTPLIVLAGQIKTADIDVFATRTHGVQEIHTEHIVPGCVKRFTRLKAEDFRESLASALTEAFANRPGPVFIEIPLDVQAVKLEYSEADISAEADRIRRTAISPSITEASKIATCLAHLLESKRPLVYVGNGCRIAGVDRAVCEFIRRHSLPAVFSWLSFDILPASDALHFGCPGGLAPMSANEILGHAETIVFLGARLDLGTTAFQRESFGGQASRFFVDIDGNELAKFSGFPNSACIQADLRALPLALEQAELNVEPSADPTWLPWCTARRQSYLIDERRRLRSDQMNVYNIAERLSTWSEGKLFVPASSGYAEETFTRFFMPGQGTRFFNGAALGAMGLGLPHAIGACFGSERRVICLEADGGIMLNLQELATVVHYAPKGFALFLLNNAGYESIRASQARYFNMTAGADQASGVYIPDFRKIAEAFGIRYFSIESLSALEALLPELGAEDPPTFVDLKIQKSEYRGPSVKTVFGADGKPQTSPISEITW